MDVKVPELGDSIQEVQIATWMKKVGDWVDRDEEIVELESEKASQNFPTPEAGVITSINVTEGEFAKIGDVLCVVDTKAAKPAVVGAGAPASGSASSGTASTSESTSFVMPAAERILHSTKSTPTRSVQLDRADG